MVSTKEFLIEYKGEQYPCFVTHKRMRRITFRLARDGKSLRVSCPYATSESFIKEKAEFYFPRLKAKTEYPSPVEGDTVYILGTPVRIEGFSLLPDKRRKDYLKKTLLAYLEDRVVSYSKEMGIAIAYKVKVRDMTSRYGVNSKSASSLTFALGLVHYSKNTIDSVIVHELSHYFYFDHSKKFYDTVYRYCPNYKKEHAKLRKHQYHE